jgi:hypothetical protein
MTSLRTRTAAVAASAALAAAGILATAPGSGATVPACGNSSLTTTYAPPQGATGHGSFVLRFKNTSHSTCSLYGYPGLDALNGAGHVLAHAQRTLRGFAGGAHVEKTVTLTPAHWASATVEWMNFNPVTSGNCTFSHSVATTPANTTHTVHLPVSVSICRLQVHPTVAGLSGNN